MGRWRSTWTLYTEVYGRIEIIMAQNELLVQVWSNGGPGAVIKWRISAYEL